MKNNTNDNLELLYSSEPHKACLLALRRTKKIHTDDRLNHINKLLKAYGVESITGDWQNGYWLNIVANYVNWRLYRKVF